MELRALKDLLWPRAEDDPAFRDEVDRLSVFGLRVVAALTVGANLLGYALFLIWLPSIPRAMASSDAFAAALMVVCVGLSFWSRVAPYARTLCWLMLATVAAVQIDTMVAVPELPITAEAVVPVFLAIVLLILVAVVPVKPAQSFALGAWMTACFFLMSFGRTRYVDLSFEDAFPVSVMLIVLVLATVVTAVVYRQRFEAFESLRVAEESFKALEAAQGRLLVSETAASQSRLAAALAHELNTPLGALSSAFNTLGSAFEKTSNDNKRLDAVVAGATEAGTQSLARLQETVARMTRVTNLDRAEVQRVDLNQLWRDAVSLQHDEIAPGVRFDLQLQPVPLIKARPQHLTAVFTNLVRNAATAIVAKGDDGTIRVSTSSLDSEIVMEVSDDGAGIDADTLATLFEPRFRAERGRVGTSNWGLFTSRGIITDHGGHIEIESELDRGTIARIRLPVEPKGG